MVLSQIKVLSCSFYGLLLARTSISIWPCLVIIFVVGCGGGAGGNGNVSSEEGAGGDGSVSSEIPVVDLPVTISPAGLLNWFDNGLAGKKICIVGDSTTSNATALFKELNEFYVKEGEALYGVDSILNFGENGASLLVFLADGIARGLTATVAEQADLYIISYGINDVRLGQTTEEQLVSMLRDTVNIIRAGVPNADIVLRMPNSLLSSDVKGFGFVQPNSNAQAYSTLLRDAYIQLEDQWENVVLLDTQDEIFGRDSLPSSIYMVDQLHPSTAGYVALAEALVGMIGQKQPFDPELAAVALETNPLAPYKIYPRIVEDPTYYELVATGRWLNSTVAGAPNGYIDFAWPMNRSGEILCGDLVQMAANYVFPLPPTCGIAPLGEITRIYNLGGSLPPFTMTGGTVNVWRERP